MPESTRDGIYRLTLPEVTEERNPSMTQHELPTSTKSLVTGERGHEKAAAPNIFTWDPFSFLTLPRFTHQSMVCLEENPPSLRPEHKLAHRWLFGPFPSPNTFNAKWG